MANKCTATCADICEHFLGLILALIICLAILIGIPLLSPLFIYRYCLKLSFKYFRPDLDKMLTCGNNLMMCADEIYKVTQNTTVVAMKVKGLPEIEDVRAEVTEKLLNAKTEDGIKKYPELMHYPYVWMGFYFWKYEEFDIKNHVAYYSLPEQGKLYTDHDIALIETELCSRSHTKNCSPWEFVIVPNVKSDSDDSLHSVVFFRTHHGLMDGFAIIKLLVEDLGGENLRKCGVLLADPQKRTSFQNFLYKSSLIFRIPYDAGYSLVKTIGITRNEFRMDQEQLSPYHIGTVPLKIPLNALKEVRYSHRVGLVSVLTALWIGALRRCMVEHNMKVPKGLIFGSPQPMPDHPGKLRVHASGANMYYNIGIEDPVARLKSIDEFLQFLKRTTSAQTLFYFLPIMGSIPPALVDALIPFEPVSGVINVFSGPSSKFHIFGKQVEEFHYSYGQQKARQCILFSALSYAGNVHMKITVNKNRFSEESEVKKIHQYILEELEALQKSAV